MSETWLGVVPEAAPKYKTFVPNSMGTFWRPLIIAPANLLLNASQTLYSSPLNFMRRSP